MKLIIAIVQDEDSSRLLSTLMQRGIGVTKLATTGGFLKAGNTPLLIGIDESRVEETILAIEEICKSRKQLTTANTMPAGGGDCKAAAAVDVIPAVVGGGVGSHWPGRSLHDAVIDLAVDVVGQHCRQ